MLAIAISASTGTDAIGFKGQSTCPNARVHIAHTTCSDIFTFTASKNRTTPISIPTVTAAPTSKLQRQTITMPSSSHHLEGASASFARTGQLSEIISSCKYRRSKIYFILNAKAEIEFFGFF
jgi:hypothetical protein